MLPVYSQDEISSLDLGLKGKNAIITGGTSGIGNCTVSYFLSQGANVVMSGRNPQVEEMAREMGAERAVGVRGDVCDAEHRKALIQAGIEHFGQVDILVNCAGITLLGNAEELPDEDWNKVIEVNLTASFLMAQAVGSYMIENHVQGCIVNVASQGGVIALKRHAAYCASKGGVLALTKVLALEWGEYGIRVNAVSPTVVMTAMGHQAWDGPHGDALKQEMPSGRFAEPEEVASAIAYLCSSGASMITGHNLIIDGGFTIK
ncbi:MAG: D-threitol dehydrogenase [Lachnospiraceae bacterium]|nr:D-threitol dehydrogenase [Lachnospiraceae bacterium]